MSKLKNIVTQKVLSLEILMWNIKALALTDKKIYSTPRDIQALGLTAQ